MKTAQDAALLVLTTGDPQAKCAAATKAYEAWQSGELQAFSQTGTFALPDRPARPQKPVLTAPRDVPKRGTGSLPRRVALLHALAHIEFNAIDLAFDMAARFVPECAEKFGAGDEFIEDWFSVGADEARHFLMLEGRLKDLDSSYGDLNAHDGHWQAAQTTRESWRARLSIVPMALEARALDVTPQTVARLESKGDCTSADILNQIYREEIGHVAKGVKWFKRLCLTEGISEDVAFHKDLEQYAQGIVKGPFNEAARREAGLLPKLYMTGA